MQLLYYTATKILLPNDGENLITGIVARNLENDSVMAYSSENIISLDAEELDASWYECYLPTIVEGADEVKNYQFVRVITVQRKQYILPLTILRTLEKGDLKDEIL
ncbi:hypothetical protein B1745_00125 [Lactobacillus amylolyticus]|uniref:hypothetical protein n=1 Tax=Lactobacillus amylolyticus TaxID=83683 RepID=UPI0009BABB52|nr:hypothetical protein [Lactobacillus amylolyticus]ARD06165.1 hypothetical protein B1745_00125 [Lactobacillus amylolyticus]